MTLGTRLLYIVLSIFFMIVGILVALHPEDVYYIQESRRSRTPGEPSDYYLIGARITGALMALAGLGCAVALLFFI